MTDKAQLRQRIEARQHALTPPQLQAASHAIAEHLLTLPCLPAAQTIFTYVSMPQEVHTHDLIRRWLADGKTVAVPLVIGRGVMQAHSIKTFYELQPGRCNILAPQHHRPLETNPDICITPCVAVSPNGDRLGHGGGYYDRYLADHPDTQSIALAFDQQLIEQIPMTPSDRRVQTIITPSGIIKCTPTP
jgi:5-formyltetrahydrofolate cyclo-ligase